MGDKQSKVKDSSLTELEITSLIENTSFTKEEILQWHEGFIVIYIFNEMVF